MSEKKFTDNEIIKALECCTTKGVSCKDCPAFVKVDRSNCRQVLIGALNIINRQKAEIERLQSGVIEQHNAITEMIKQAKVKAVKEFALELKRIPRISVYKNEIDNLLREKVGE